jgi:DNA ligase (NAD+)
MELKIAVEKIFKAKKDYYQKGTSDLSDQEYDALESYIKTTSPNHPILSLVGHNPAPGWKKDKHFIPMGSLNKCHTVEDFNKWASNYRNEKFITQLKLDGLSLSLDYENSCFLKALTRGDGLEGEDISINVQLMKGFFKKIENFSGSLRAEILLDQIDFETINNILPEKEQYSNARNAAAGISRRLDGIFSQYLHLCYYDIMESLDEDLKINKLNKLNLFTPHNVVGTLQEMIQSYENIKNIRKVLPFNIDGVVIKVCSKNVQQAGGSINNRPKAQIAWKFDPPGALTQIEDVSWEVGRTGIITPLAHLKPVNIEGTIIKNSTIHNIAEISRLKLGIGDTVMLVKCGDIIPKITSVIEFKGVKIQIPTVCPSCGGPLENDGIRLFCRSDVCPAKNHYRIMNWIKVVGIDNLGESTIDALEKVSVIKSIKDIYGLTISGIACVTGGEKSAEKVFTNIQGTKILPLQKFLAGIGIPSLSTKTAGDLVDNFKTIEGILAITVDDLNKIKGYSDISSNAIVIGLNNFKKEILDLLTVVQIDSGPAGGKLSGMSFCFTGNLAHPRPFYQALVTKNGGKNDSSVTKTTTYLVCNENKGSSKSMKAEKCGVKIINEQQFIDLCFPGTVTGRTECRNDAQAVAFKEVYGGDKIKNYSLFEEENDG